MPYASEDFVWLPLTNTCNFGEQMVAGDLIGIMTEAHGDALLSLRDIYNVRPMIWGEPSDTVTAETAVVEEIYRYNAGFFLASMAYYVGVSLQFLLAVQLNPIYTVDGVLKIGKVEKQAKLLSRILQQCLARYEALWPLDAEFSSMCKYVRHLQPVLERMSGSDIFNPINKECLPLERLRELAGGKVSLFGHDKGWTVRGAKGKRIAQNVDGGLAVMEAVSALQYGTETK